MTERREDDAHAARPAEDAVRAALARITASDPFRTAPQLVAFLTFVVEKTLAGQESELKGYTIATRALGRPPGFDPQSDPIVRVEAMRLRRALEAYYATTGAGETLVISIPRGSYVPRFGGPGTAPEPEPPTPPLPAPPPLRRFLPLALAGVAGLALGALGVWLLRGWSAPHGPAVTVSDRAPYLPLLVVSEVEAVPGGPAAEAVRANLLETLARFDEIIVSADPRPGARGYRLSLRIAPREGGFEAIARLADLRAGEVLWTRTFPVPDVASGGEARERALAGQIAARIAPPYGLIGSDQRAREHNDARARCIARVYDYWFEPGAMTYGAARDCLARDFEGDRHSPLALAYLAYVHLDGVRSGFDPRPGALDRALAAARRAVELAPESARARQVLMNVQFGRGEVAEALRSGEEALGLNPLDSDFTANFGARLIEAGRYAEGVKLLQRAATLAPQAPTWHSAFLLVAYLMLGDEERAALAARGVAADHPLGLLGRIVLAHRVGRTEERARLAGQLATIHPDLARDPDTYLARRGFGPDFVARMRRDLTAAGIEGGAPRP